MRTGAIAVTLALSAMATGNAVAQDWTGLYGGVSASYHEGENREYENGLPYVSEDDLLPYPQPFNRDGDMYGAFLGYRFQVGTFLVGPELAYQSGSIEMVDFSPNKVTDMTTVQVKAGYVIDRVLLTAGIGAFKGNLKPGCVDICGVMDLSGPVMSVGADYLVTDTVTVGAVITHRRYKDEVYPNVPNFTTDGKDTAFEFRVGYNF